MPAESVIINTFLTGWREFVAGADAEATALREIGVAAGFTAGSFEKTTAKTWAMNQALFTARRVVYGGTLVLLGAGAAALRLGWSYQTAMQQATVAMRPVFRDQAQLKSELGTLFRISAYTPFQFKDITTAFRQMYLAMHPLGISAATVNTTIHSLTDALSATGRTSPGALNRVAVALQHMAYMGRLTGQVVLQLARDGLPIYAALQKELGLNAEQLHNIGAEGISSASALHALNSYIESTPGFMNAAFRQATGTLFGAWTTFKDLLSQAVGSSNSGFFGVIQRTLQRIDAALEPFTRRGQPLTITDFMKAVDQIISPRTHAVLAFFELLAGTMRGFNLTMKTVAFTIQAVLWPLGLLGTSGQHLAMTTRYLGIVLGVYLGSLLLWRSYLIAAAIAEHIWDAALIVGRGVMVLYGLALNLVRGARAAWTAATVVATAVEGANTGVVLLNTEAQTINSAVTWERDAATGALVASTIGATVATEAATGAVWGLTAAMLANPIGLIIAAVVLLTVGLVVLYFKWKAFHDLVNATAHWLWSHWPYTVAIIAGMLGPVGLLIIAVGTLVKYWKEVVSWATKAGHAIHNATDFARKTANSSVVQGILHYTNPLNLIPHFATGGTMGYSGLALVGERGPEMVHLPAGARVSPSSVPMERGTLNVLLDQTIKIMLDGQELTRSVATAVTDKEARS